MDKYSILVGYTKIFSRNYKNNQCLKISTNKKYLKIHAQQQVYLALGILVIQNND